MQKINQFDLEGNFIKQYSSLKEAAEDNNTQYQSISTVLRGKRKQHNNYIYKYLGEEPEPVIKKKNQGRQTAQYDLEGNFIAIYPSANQAAAAIGKILTQEEIFEPYAKESGKLHMGLFGNL